jgi:hypothetical protein
VYILEAVMHLHSLSMSEKNEEEEEESSDVQMMVVKAD